MKIRKGTKVALYFCRDRLGKCKSIEDFLTLFGKDTKWDDYSLVGAERCSKVGKEPALRCTACAGETKVEFAVIRTETTERATNNDG